MRIKNIIYLGVVFIGAIIMLLGFMGAGGQGFFAIVNQNPIGTTVIGGVIVLLFLALSARPPQ